MSRELLQSVTRQNELSEALEDSRVQVGEQIQRLREVHQNCGQLLEQLELTVSPATSPTRSQQNAEHRVILRPATPATSQTQGAVRQNPPVTPTQGVPSTPSRFRAGNNNSAVKNPGATPVAEHGEMSTRPVRRRAIVEEPRPNSPNGYPSDAFKSPDEDQTSASIRVSPLRSPPNRSTVPRSMGVFQIPSDSENEVAEPAHSSRTQHHSTQPVIMVPLHMSHLIRTIHDSDPDVRMEFAPSSGNSSALEEAPHNVANISKLVLDVPSDISASGSSTAAAQDAPPVAASGASSNAAASTSSAVATSSAATAELPPPYTQAIDWSLQHLLPGGLHVDPSELPEFCPHSKHRTWVNHKGLKGATNVVPESFKSQRICRGFMDVDLANKYYQECLDSGIFDLLKHEYPRDCRYLVLRGTKPGVYDSKKNLVIKGLSYRSSEVRTFNGTMAAAWALWRQFKQNGEVSTLAEEEDA
ncbi:hypothetical protein VNI00_017135 [Paramarasmius palmivorus]|uniref:Uncharacterized protein n=1 Tax=Paramarasmius palmivorus TaxID=297713 RepID=A0AAW0B8A7_9AGAR